MLRRRSSQVPTRISECTPSNGATSSNRNSRSKIPKINGTRTQSAGRRPSIEIEPPPHTIKRSKSNLGLTTPINNSCMSVARGSTQQRSNCKQFVSDSRPFSDKKWQLVQLNKIQDYLARHTGDHILSISNSLRPLQTKSFVEVCRMILISIDPKFNINPTNYVEELPVILHILRYPMALKKSLLSTVNIPRNWGLALGIMSWLVELLNGHDIVLDDINTCGRDGLEPETFNTNFSVIKYKDWLATGKEVDGYLQEYLDHEMESRNLKQKKEASIKEKKKLNSSLKAIQSEYAEYLKTYKSSAIAQGEFEELRTSIQQQLKNRQMIKEGIETKERMLKSLKSKLESSMKEVLQVKEIVDNQKFSKEERLSMLNERQKLIEKNNTIQDLISHLVECAHTEELKMVKINQRVIALSREFNKVCLTERELEKFDIVELPLLNEESPMILSNFKDEMKNMLEDKESEAKKLEQKKISVLNDLKQCQTEFETLVNAEKKVIPELKEEMERMVAEQQSYQESMKDHSFEVRELTDQVKAITEQINELKEQEKLYRESVAAKTKKMNEVFTSFAEKNNAQLDEVSKILESASEVVNKTYDKYGKL